MLGEGLAMFHAVFGWHTCLARDQDAFYATLVLLRQMKVGIQS